MKIVIEALGIHRMGGGRTSILTLISHILKQEPEHQYQLILSQTEKSLAKYANVQQVIAPIKNPYFSRIWAQAVVPSLCRNSDLVHFTKNLNVFGIRAPQVVTIHDLILLHHPEYFPLIDVAYWKSILKIGLQSANKIIAISQATKTDLKRFYKIRDDKIEVIYWGVSDHFSPRTPEEVETTRRKYQLPDQYLLYVGRIDVRKNLTTLVRAFRQIRDQQAFSGKLVFVGDIYHKSPDHHLLPTIKELALEDMVIFTGPVPYEDLPALYSGASAFVLPSRQEGFGMIILEAFACGTPVIAHCGPGILEVAGNGGFLVDANKPFDLAEGIIKVVNDRVLRDQLIHNGFLQAKRFNWTETAKRTLSIYQEIA